MGKTTRKTKALRLTEQDFAIIEKLQQYSGVASQNEVIRMALRAALREQERAALSSLPLKGGGSSRAE